MTGSFKGKKTVHTCWSVFYTVNSWALVSNYQICHKESGLGFKPQTSEVGGKCITRYITKPPVVHQ